MNLHKEIMNIQIQSGIIVPVEWNFDLNSYKLGHRDALHAAAELSLKAEARIEELEEALIKAREDINWMLNSEQFLNSFVFDYIDEVLKK